MSIHRATNEDVLVAFSCSNLANVAQFARSRYKTVVLCGDTGAMDALVAEEVAGDIGGELFIPEFPE